MKRRLSLCCTLVAILIFAASISSPGLALASSGTPRGEAFASKEAALKALADAARAHDTAALTRILGPDSKGLVNSGDEVADKAAGARIAAAYDQMHRFASVGNGRVIIYLGAENWPSPIPLVERNGKWYFDTAYGKQEILARRIGRNELEAIKVCEAIVQAQQDYASQVQTGEDGKQFAQKFLSDDGKHNGLFWKTAAGEPDSPLGPLIVSASNEGYRRGTSGKPTPYHGYIYKMLTAQGQHAPGGARSYLQDGKLTGGFAVIAYPATYRSSGIMTFMVGQDGVVYQKNLGASTDRVAPAIKAYDPDDSWQPVPKEDSGDSGSDQS
ncbi:MAG TPA: DUF2950 domain-containing protein [Candidatus Binataceae bacterium]|nr:DUF2950 domain-containing protein [Candidatus Binataceae bacterium]